MRNLFSLRTGFLLLVVIVVAVGIIPHLITRMEIEEVKITGPIYDQIIDSQGMVIDAMPPRMYASEAYIALLSLASDSRQEARLSRRQKLELAKKDFQAAYHEWEQRVGREELNSAFGTSWRTGNEFFRSIEESIDPLLDANAESGMLMQTISQAIQPKFELHRQQILQEVESAKQHRLHHEQSVRAVTRMWNLRHYLFDLTWIGLVLGIAWVVGQKILRLQQAKERFLFISTISSTAFAIVDQNGKITWTNDGFETLTGYTLEEVLHRSLIEYCIDTQNDHHSMNAVQQVIDSGSSCKLQLTKRNKHGRDYTVILEMQPTRQTHSGETAYVVAMTDITLQVTLHARMHSIFHSLSEGIVLQGLDGQIIDCNPAAEQHLGVSRPSILSRSSVDPRWRAIHPDGTTWDGSTHPAMETLRTQKPIENAMMGLEFPDGKRRWISINTQPVLGSNGTLQGVISSFSDVSTLRSEKERLNLAMEGAQVAVWEWQIDRDRLLISGNEGPLPATSDHQSYSYTTWRSKIHPEDLKAADHLLAQHLASRSSDYRSEHRMLSKNQEWMWVLEAGRITERHSNGLPTRMSGIHLDISHSKLLEQQLRESERRTRLIVDTSMDAVIGMDTKGIVTDWNINAENTFGWTAFEAIGNPLSKLIIPLHLREAHEQGFRRFLHSGESKVLGKRLELPAMHKLGHPLDVELSINKLESDGDLSFTAFLRDITEKKKMEARLAQSQRLESIGQLAAGVAHEINTPVQFVNDSVQFLSDGFRDLFQLVQDLKAVHAKGQASESSVGQLLDEIEEKADAAYLVENVPKAIDRALGGLDRISEIVRSMRNFSHQGSNEQTYVDLNRSLQSTLTVTRNEYKYIATIETDFGDLPEIRCNGSELNQVFLNLIVNAAHAIESVVGNSGQKGKIRVQSRLLGEHVEIRISDTGIGIPPDIQYRIFEPFFTTKEVGKGTGQGLAIVYNIVQKKHGGTIEVESQVGEGTTFILRLPRDGLPQEAADVQSNVMAS